MFEIKAEILAKAIHCSKKHGCLDSESSNHCLNIEIVKCISNKILFVKCNNNFCKYRMKYGHQSTICNCPIRIAIYNKYGK